MSASSSFSFKHCLGSVQEAAYLMLNNNLHKDVAEDPSRLIVYGGTGKAARNPQALAGILNALRQLKNDETLLVQSGKAVGIVRTHEEAPRVLIANSNLVPNWAHWDEFRRLESLGLTMYGQMTAGSWIYIGTQGILQGTYETFLAAKNVAINKHKSPLSGARVPWVLTAGLGGMGGAQPLAAKIAGLSSISVEIDRNRIQRRLDTAYVDREVSNFEDAISLIKQTESPISLAVCANASTFYRFCVSHGIVPDLVTEQTSAHDPLNGYIPEGLTLEDAIKLRSQDPKTYVTRAKHSMSETVNAMLWMQTQGAEVFDYGNNIRTFAKEAGCANAFLIPGFIPAYIRSQFCVGRGPFRFVALSGDPQDIAVADQLIKDTFPNDAHLHAWLKAAQIHVKYQGLPARICWLGHGERERIGLRFNDYVKQGKFKGPLVIGRDHLDCGSVASPYRETEAMKDGSDAIADWPILNALVNTACGASWVSFHHGGGVGIGYSLHAGMVVVADGTNRAEHCLSRVLNADPLMGVIRHVDAGYEEAITYANQANIELPQ